MGAAKQIKIDFSNIRRVMVPTFYPLLNCRSRWLVLKGGGGSGKSKFAARKVVFRTLTEKPHKFLVMRKIGATIRDSAFADIVEAIQQWGLTPLFRIYESRLEIVCINGNKILFKGLDNPEKVKSISGITGVWLEEATDFEQNDVDQINLRLRDQTRNYKQIIVSFNPISETHWIKRYFFDFERSDATVHESTYKDNPFLPPEYVAQLDALEHTNPDYYRVYALGEWGTLGELVYTNYQVSDSVPTDFNSYEKVFVGMDFGYHDPSTLVCVGYRDQTLYVFKVLYEQYMTNSDWIEQVKAANLPENIRIIADSEAPDRIEEFRRAGLWVDAAKKGKDSVRTGIDFVKRHKIMIHPSCSPMIKEISSYAWRKNKDGQAIDEPIGINDHTLDALRYAVEPLRLEAEIFTQDRFL